jgi:hypothetical protein
MYIVMEEKQNIKKSKFALRSPLNDCTGPFFGAVASANIVKF